MSENKRNFLVHGGILAMAGILVRIIGMFYRIPLVNIIGSDGNGIYGAAYKMYTKFSRFCPQMGRQLDC